jgi:hypothetical protein
MPSRLKRVSEPTEAAITTLAEREGRTFVAQLDRVVHAGLVALGEPSPLAPAATPAPAQPRRRRATAAAAAG